MQRGYRGRHYRRTRAVAVWSSFVTLCIPSFLSFTSSSYSLFSSFSCFFIPSCSSCSKSYLLFLALFLAHFLFLFSFFQFRFLLFSMLFVFLVLPPPPPFLLLLSFSSASTTFSLHSHSYVNFHICHWQQIWYFLFSNIFPCQWSAGGREGKAGEKGEGPLYSLALATASLLPRITSDVVEGILQVNGRVGMAWSLGRRSSTD